MISSTHIYALAFILLISISFVSSFTNNPIICAESNCKIRPQQQNTNHCKQTINHHDTSSSKLHSSRNNQEDIYAAVHRKEYEMKRLNAQHASLSDPIRMAMGYAQDGIERKRLAAALRRVYDDPTNTANPNAKQKTEEEIEREEKLLENGMADATMRRGSFIVDIKRKSNLSYPGENFARYDDASLVAEAMVL